MDCATCCRLGVSSATGRLRWCVPEKDCSRRFRFVITAIVLMLVLLAISAVIVVRLSGLCNSSNSTLATAESGTSQVEEVEENVLPIRLPAREPGELEKRGLPYMTTEFVPPLVQTSPLTKQPSVGSSDGHYSRTRRRRKRNTPWDVVLTNQKIQEVIWPSPRPQEEGGRPGLSNLFQLPVFPTLFDKSSGAVDYPSNPGDLEELDWNPVPSRSRSSVSSSETPAPSIDTPDGNANSYVRFYPHSREPASDLRRYYSHN